MWGGAGEILDWRWRHEPEPQPASQGVPETQVSIGALGKLGADGYLYKVLPDGDDLDITPRCSRKYYILSIGTQKHKLRIQAKNVTLEQDRFVPGSEFCVGETLDFIPYFEPDVPGWNLYAADWALSTKFVNNWAIHPATMCTYYWVDDSVLKELNTRAWYVDGGKKAALLDLKMVFDNGQKAKVVELVRLRTYRPPAYLVEGDHAHAKWNIIPGGMTELRIGPQPGWNPIFIICRIPTRFPGTAFYTQICTLDTSDGSWQAVLDGSWIYNGVTFEQFVNENPQGDSQNVAQLEDGPGVWGVFSPLWFNGQFDSYLRFVPDGDGRNIPITLGICRWSINGRAEKINGVWLKTVEEVSPAQALTPSDEFPSWIQVKY